MGLWRVMKSGLCMRTGNDQLSGWTEKKLQSTSQSQTYTKKGHGHCLVVCCRSHPVQLFESQWNHYIWEVCSANRWDALKTAAPASGIGEQKGASSSLRQCLTAYHTTSTSKVERIGLWSFALSTVFTCHLANRLPLLQASRQLFAEKTLPQPAGGRKCFPGVHWILKDRFFYVTEISKLISGWQKCVDCNGSYFDY